MPYNTRRKSLSLPSLGIQLPPNSRALPSNRSPPSVPPVESPSPPSKKVKRSHTTSSPTSPSPATKPDRPKSAPKYEDTPPPSPRPSLDVKIDTQGINDDIVTAVIEQLEKTGNKPQLVKELAAVLCNTLNIVESSANPQAIISSRLNGYLKRPWTALSPCPVAKTLIPTHPRRIYFYLTNTPHQSIPTPSSESPLASTRRTAVISPSLSSDEDHEARKRAALSPSPEVDLSVPDLEDADIPPTPAGSYSGRSSLARDGSSANSASDGMGHSHRAVSPPLEGDEKEFTQTASVMQSKRSTSLDQNTSHDQDSVRISTEDESGEGRASNVTAEESDESAEARNLEAAAALFGQPQQPITTVASGLSSSAVRPNIHLQIHTTSSHTKRTTATDDVIMMDIDSKGMDPESHSILGLGWGHEMISPEKVELDELDDLLGEF